MRALGAILPQPVMEHYGVQAKIGLIAFGSTDIAVREAIQLLQQDVLEVDYLRVRSVPFAKSVAAFIAEHERCYVIEMNTNGQLRQLLQLETPQYAARLHSIRKNDGLPLTATWIAEQLRNAGGE